MAFAVIISICVLFGGWSFLSVLGNERQRQLQNRDQANNAQAATTPQAPVGGQVAH
jgi:hypothetical protein